MGEYEDEIRGKISERYGSIPKMSKATGIPTNTIYHALDRGMDNTTTRTRKLILDALYDETPKDEQPGLGLSLDESELIDLFRAMSDDMRVTLLDTARNFAALSGGSGDADGARVERAGCSVAE